MTIINKYHRGYSVKNIIVFDVETTIPKDGSPFELKLAVIENNDNYVTCFSRHDMTQHIINFSRYGRSIVFATNSEFDFSFIDHSVLKDNGYDLLGFNNSPFFAVYKNRDRRRSLLFLDTLNFAKMSVKQMGEMVGISKLDIDFETCTLEELEVYCKQDCKITRKFVNWIEELHELYDIDFCFTFPQLAYRTFRKHYLKSPLEVSDNVMIRELERESYRGGRVEVFDFNEYDVVYYNDFNSLYPYVMKEFNYPVKCIEYFSLPNCLNFGQKIMKQKMLSEMRKGNGVIARVKVDIPLIHIAPVPVLYNKKMMFPCGEFTTSLCSPELELVLPHIKMIYELAIYEMTDLFSGFVDDFYKRRIEAKEQDNSIMDLFYKLFMNSLYGKFGQRKFIDKRLKKFDGLFEFHAQTIYDSDEDALYSAKWLGGKCYIKEAIYDNPYSFVAISSFVTSYARLILYRFLIQHEHLVIYCDTDSIVLPYAIGDNNELGGLKIEKVFNDFQALGNKIYRYSGGYKIKSGVKEIFDAGYRLKGVKTKFASTGEKSLIEWGTKIIKVKSDRISRMKEGIRRFDSPLPRIVDANKDITLDYDKRVVITDNKTMPLMIRKP